MISFIGYYNYTVILTYISLFCSIAGMLFTVNGWYIDGSVVPGSFGTV